MKKYAIILVVLTVFISACSNVQQSKQIETEVENMKEITDTKQKPPELKEATFAGGCFWCIESAYDDVTGVKSAISGFSGGEKQNPTYKEVSSGKTKHTESVKVTYDSNVISYGELLDIFWREIDPTDSEGQFVDRGAQYRPAIFYNNDKEKELIEKTQEVLEKSGKFDKPFVVEIVPFSEFYPAEEYHQDYHKKNPIRYKIYRFNSGRDQYLEKIWGDDEIVQKKIEVIDETTFTKPSKEELKKMLTKEQYKITQKDGTERAFDNEYWDNKEEGIYVDLVSGEALFSSKDKFKSGTGWPSFTKPLEAENIIEREDRKLFSIRTEIRSKNADSHLGHLFDDGPEPTGLRYCMNSAALKFIPKESLEEEGYEQYMDEFE